MLCVGKFGFSDSSFILEDEDFVRDSVDLFLFGFIVILTWRSVSIGVFRFRLF